MRVFLDDWRPWVGIAYFALVVMMVVLFFLNRAVVREQAAREAETKAGAVSARDNCYRLADNNPDLLAIIAAVRLLSRNSIQASQAALAIDPTGPLAPVRRASIRRSRKAVIAADKFRDQIAGNTPTEARCDALAERLGLQPRPKEEG